MKTTMLKVKVLFCWGLLVALLFGLYLPEFVKAAMPFVLCVALAAALLYSPEYMPAVMRIIKRVIPKATTPQATKVAAGCVNATWSPKIDYENYEIPSYARRGGAQ